MIKYKEVPATKKAILRRKPIYGVGINDADYLTQRKKNKKVSMCPYYSRWVRMLARCYSPYRINKRLSYVDCFVCDEWLTFSNFKKWMQSQDWHGKDLDKDLLSPKNKLYAPEFCVFVSKEVNSSIAGYFRKNGKYPIGVTFSGGGYVANISKKGKNYKIGVYSSIQEASNAFKKEKAKVLIKLAKNQSDKKVKKGLLNFSELIMESL